MAKKIRTFAGRKAAPSGAEAPSKAQNHSHEGRRFMKKTLLATAVSRARRLFDCNPGRPLAVAIAGR